MTTSLRLPLRCGLLCFAALGVGTGGAVRTQQYGWQPGPAFVPIGSLTVAYDAARQRVVMVPNGGISGELWEGDGAVWRQAAVGGPLAGRGYPYLAYDSARSAVLMFGGAIQAVYQNDLWSWNGTAWTQIVTPQAPPPRNVTAMVYDAARARLVLYGGFLTGPVDETWEFDGTTWAQKFPANRPTARLGHALVYDQVAGTTLLFGGYATSQQQLLAETWTWDGIDWTRRLPAQSPPARRSGGLVCDPVRARLVLNGGMNVSAAVLTDTWVWDGANWSQVATTGSAPASAVPTVCFDLARGETVHVAIGSEGMRTWAFDGANWNLAIESTNALRDHHAIAYDPVRDCAVSFGGVFGLTPLDQTWEFRSGVWHHVLTPAKPSAREFTALAFDPGNQQMLLFGGSAGLADTWLYDGVSWTQRTPAIHPPARTGHALATDTGRGRIVLFGGATFQPAGWRNDTWEWDGTTWLQRTPAQSPPVRSNHAMAYDPLRARTVVYGGGDLSITPSLADHWEWDGTGWTQIAATAAPGQRIRPGLVFDDAAGRIVLFGGYDMSWVLPFPHNDTWEWDGATWTQRSTANPPMARMNGAVTWLSASRRLLLNAGGTLADTWLLADASIASVASYGTPCTGPAGMPALRADGLPLRGNRWFEVQLSSVPAHAPVVLGLSVVQANAPLGGGCTALVDQAALLWQVADPRGSCRFALPIPNVPALHGAAVFAQGLTIATGGALAGVAALSAGLRVVVD